MAKEAANSKKHRAEESGSFITFKCVKTAGLATVLQEYSKNLDELGRTAHIRLMHASAGLCFLCFHSRKKSVIANLVRERQTPWLSCR